MTEWQVFWVAVAAVALVVMAGVQVAVALAAMRVARQTTETMQGIRSDLRPLIEKVGRVADDAERATALALVQVERVDHLLEIATERVDTVLTAVQDAVVTPLRRGSAWVAAFRAAWAVFKSAQDSARQRREDEEALFVG